MCSSDLTIFWHRRQFQRLMTPGKQKLGRRQNSSIWSFLAVFVGYSTQFLALETISMARDPWYTKNWDVVKTRRFGHFWLFSWAIAHNFWLRRRFQRLVTPGTQKLGRRQNSSIRSFWLFLWAVAHRFWLWGRSQRLVTPSTRLL